MILFGVKFRNHKVIGVTNCLRAEISSAQSREKPMSLALIDYLQKGILNQYKCQTCYCLMII